MSYTPEPEGSLVRVNPSKPYKDGDIRIYKTTQDGIIVVIYSEEGGWIQLYPATYT
jgi:hypothetical protein